MKVIIIQSSEVLTRTKNSRNSTGTIYDVIDSYSSGDEKILIIQNPIDPEDIIIIAEKAVEYIKEAVSIWNNYISPAIQKTKNFFGRVWSAIFKK